MTKEQIETYEYCKKYLVKLEEYSKSLPFKSQEFGCGSNRPNIEYNLEKVHQSMHTVVFNAMQEAKDMVNKIIDKL